MFFNQLDVIRAVDREGLDVWIGRDVLPEGHVQNAVAVPGFEFSQPSFRMLRECLEITPPKRECPVNASRTQCRREQALAMGNRRARSVEHLAGIIVDELDGIGVADRLLGDVHGEHGTRNGRRLLQGCDDRIDHVGH